MKTEHPYCSVCGSTDIAKDAFASWDNQTQQWELHSTYDASKCLNEACEADDSIEWAEVELTYMLRWTTNGGQVTDGDERFNTRELAQEARSLLLSAQNQEENARIDWSTIHQRNMNLIKRVDVIELVDGVIQQ